MRRLHALVLKVAAALVALTTVAAAQYPTKPVRLIIPFPPGAINDTVGRIVASQLSTRLGKQFVVDNRSGAGGIIAYELVAHAPKDGHTLLIVSSAMTLAPWMQKLPYDSKTAFAPVAMLAAAPAVVAANRDLPAQSLKELIATAKERPGKLQYGSSGVGTFLHMSGELFKLTAGVDILHVPFRGAAPAMIDAIAGNIQLVFASIGSSMPHLRSGQLKALGVAAANRNPLLPDVPTAAEAGVPGYIAANWFGVMAPAGTPQPIIERLHREITEIQDSPELQKQLTNDGAEIVRMSSAEFGAFVAAETEKWGRVVKAAGIKPE